MSVSAEDIGMVAPPPASGAPPVAAGPAPVPLLPAAAPLVVDAVLPLAPEAGEPPALAARLPAIVAPAPAVLDCVVAGAELPPEVFGGDDAPAEVVGIAAFPALEEDGVAGPCSVGISIVCCEGAESSQAAMPSMSTRMVKRLRIRTCKIVGQAYQSHESIVLDSWPGALFLVDSGEN
ncbi:MAG TPA: hypothetical protein VFN67_10775 [Polyangiales bacterium]|nr:hypothetical protein [Polyangiales bacterium]